MWTPHAARLCGAGREGTRPNQRAHQGAALQAVKARGRKLGSPIAAQTAAKARAARSTYARAASASARAVVQDIKASGVTTLKGIAAALQARGVCTPRGNVVWAPAQISRLLPLPMQPSAGTRF